MKFDRNQMITLRSALSDLQGLFDEKCQELGVTPADYDMLDHPDLYEFDSVITDLDTFIDESERPTNEELQ